MSADLAARLAAVAALPDQKQKLEEYKRQLQATLASASVEDCNAFVDHSAFGCVGARGVLEWRGDLGGGAAAAAALSDARARRVAGAAFVTHNTHTHTHTKHCQ